MSLLSAIIGGGIILVLALRALWIMRAEARQDDGGRPRGIPPGDGYTEIVSEYCSGAGGGGNRLVTRVPQDPQEYARAFVPRRNGTHRS
ncbi:hypothetical protein [uncultured Jannaschia sp.]|uniref:hypothetical protein n=1 Tax=uncultured Jannaschia sp. TaxID=293347 RepID=UPI00261FB16D|nr:hypothetical protein [uncultured Jannaschia sp.]